MSGKRRLGRNRAVLLLTAIFLLAANVSQAKYSGGTGEPNSPYRIETPNDLNDIGNHVEDFNDCFVLVNDINMAGYTYTTALIAPDTNSDGYGFQGTAFTGIFDGNDCIIINFTVDTAGAGNWCLGLFGQIGQTGQVKNLGMKGVNITGGDNSWWLGGLCGVNSGRIRNCYSTACVSAGVSCSSLGGLCGFSSSGVVAFSKCYATGSVSGGDYSISLGGLCGETWGDTISNCHATTSVSGAGGAQFIGGLCGWNGDGTIRNCYATGSVTGEDNSSWLGGLCGLNYGVNINCYATGSITGGNNSNHLGGLAGDTWNHISNSYATGSVSGGNNSYLLGGLCGYIYHNPIINNSYATGSVTGGAGADYLGGFCGDNDNGTISNCYFLDPSDGGGPDNGYGTPLTDNQMKQQNSFSSWDFVDEVSSGTWRLCEDGITYPILQWQSIPGDLLCPDGVIFTDYSFFANYWGDTNCDASNNCDWTDLDFSDKVDANDLKIFCDHWLEGL